MLRGKQFTIRREGKAAAAITPGHLVTFNSSGLVIKHATAGGAAPKWFAYENELFGGGIDDAYAANDQVLIECVPTGGEVYGLVAAAAVAIVIGDLLESDGAGGFRKLASGVPLGVATEAVNNSGGGTPARLRVAIL
jgi:hypothetical protein